MRRKEMADKLIGMMMCMPEPFDAAWVIIKAPLFQQGTVSDVGYSDAFNFPQLEKPELGFQG